MTNQDLFDRAVRTAPGGVHSPVRAFKSVGGTPVFVASAAGPRFTDVTGASYIDFCLSFGPLILGHADPVVAAEVHRAVDDGWTYGACEPYSLALAEWIIGRVPWVERVRFVSSGTEAVMSALRVARAATGRSRILKFEGCYHGHADGLLVRAGSGLAGAAAATSAGLPGDALTHTLVVPLDDEAAFDAIFDAHAADIAAVIVEPVPANYGLLPQRREWLTHVAARCSEAGALLVLDEVITGFRTGLQGASGAFDLRPDLVCYGKIIGGGFPVGAYAGRADLLVLVAPAGPVYQAGTLSANPVGMRAGLATLARMASLDGWPALDARAAGFVRQLRERFAASAPSVHVDRHASIVWIRKGGEARCRRPDTIPPAHAAWFPKFFHTALKRGIYLPPSAYEVLFLSMAHDEDTLAVAIDALVAAAEEADRS
ncbi:MAG: glutamate-1-semialdehyde 2,1-aminomutase [Acidobacteriota bacterium]